MMAKVKPVEVATPKPYTVRKGFVVHKERINSKGQILSDAYDGDDPDNNIVELTDAELPKYRHQLELEEDLEPAPENAIA